MGEKQKLAACVDSLERKSGNLMSFDLPLARYIVKYKKSSVLFSRKGRTGSFFTRDSKLYITPEEYAGTEKGRRIIRITGRLDSLHSRNFENTRIYSIGREDLLYLNLKRRYSGFRNYFMNSVWGSVRGIPAVKLWNLSIVGSVIFGMLTMSMIYRYLGQNVSAKIQEKKILAQEQESVNDLEKYEENEPEEIDANSITRLMKDPESENQKNLEEEILALVKGYPIEQMVPEIAKRDRIVAAFIVGIAKKESNWGKRVPVRDGQDCYNYWGYRGIRDKMGTGGHTCFDSPEDAVNTVAKRIEFLVSNEKLNTPAKMVIWKCGYDCSWDSQNAINKWISDVSLYFKKLNRE